MMIYSKTFLHSPPFPKSIVFDWEGTLVDSSRDILQALNRVLTAFSQPPLSREALMTLAGQNLVGVLKKHIPPIYHVQAETLYQQQALSFMVRPLNHVLAMLDWLKSLPLPIAVVSNKEGSKLRQDIHRLGWSDLFYATVGAGDVTELKPSGQPLLHALELGGKEAGSDIWFVGDSSPDVLCAQNAGCTPIFINTAPWQEESVRTFAHMKSFTDFLQNCYYTEVKKHSADTHI